MRILDIAYHSIAWHGGSKLNLELAGPPTICRLDQSLVITMTYDIAALVKLEL